VGGQVSVTLLVTVVLGDEVEVLATDDDGALHLGGHDLTGQDTTTDRDITGEGALLIDVVTLDGLLGGLETKTDILVPTVALGGLLARNLGVLEDTLLLLESLGGLLALLNAEDVETDGLGEGSALTDSDNVTSLNTDESRRQMGRQVPVTLLITVVLGNVMQVLATDGNGALHLGRDNDTGEDTTTDGNITSEGALLVDVGTLDGFLGGLETKTNLLVPTVVSLLGDLGVLENSNLLLEGFFDLFRHG